MKSYLWRFSLKGEIISNQSEFRIKNQGLNLGQTSFLGETVWLILHIDYIKLEPFSDLESRFWENAPPSPPLTNVKTNLLIYVLYC